MSTPSPDPISVGIVCAGDESPAVQAVELATAAGWLAKPILFDGAWGPSLFEWVASEPQLSGFDWIFYLPPGELAHPQLFETLRPYLGPYDAIWGGLTKTSRNEDDGPAGKLVRITRLACQDDTHFFHLALNWWIGRAHIVRQDCLGPVSAQLAEDETWQIRYFLRLWQNLRCMKTAQPLTQSVDDPVALLPGERKYLIDSLKEDPRFLSVHVAGQTAYLTYTGLNLNVEREQTRGLFYEQDELFDLVGRLPPNARIVDVGANTGNHSIFLAMALPSSSVLAIEPGERSILALKAAVAKNRLSNIDLSKLGVGAGASKSKASLDLSRKSLGDAKLAQDPDGAISVVPLDDLIEGHVDLIKIDVEGMELDVLAGTKSTLKRSRPLLFIEVADSNYPAFMAWLSSSGYRIDRIYPDKTHANFVLVPKIRAG